MSHPCLSLLPPFLPKLAPSPSSHPSPPSCPSFLSSHPLDLSGSDPCVCVSVFRWGLMHSEEDSSLQLLLKETCAFRQQSPGKFCLLMCSLCTFMAVLGRYIPGVVLSYALVLGFFLWPLLSSLDLGMWLKPVLHKVDEGTTAGLFPDRAFLSLQLDSTLCKELCVSDTEPSDLSWTDGLFTLSEGHTPHSEGHTPFTDQSEELDREDFPSLDNGHMTNGTSDEEDLYPAIPAPQPDQPITALYSDTISMSELGGHLVSALIQERLESALAPALPLLVPGQESTRAGEKMALEDSDSDVEDFELLDQSELEQCEAELGLIQEQSPEHSLRHTTPGFISKLLRRH
uniref:RETREG1-3/ARL6IP-like N-terminal reticulon-homology domain-containing protein n=1 Tax=Periophthalmus magnuspinnatus TaxID=409849 RepID=A0A3B4AYR8_9GOBI